MKVAACLYVRDEERDIAEWLAFQFAVGFDACLVYDNGSVDRTPEIAQAFGRKFDVRLQDWPCVTTAAQPGCYRSCLNEFGGEFDWIAFIDADELIVPRQGGIKTLLEQHEDASAVVINWAMFGSSRHMTRPPGLMIETFTRRAKSDFVSCGVVKWIVRPAAVTTVRAPCNFLVDGPVCTPAGRVPQWIGEGKTQRAEHSVAQLNHYFTRSREEWDRSLVRGYRDRDDGNSKKRRSRGKFVKYDRNEMLDRGAFRFVPQVRDIMAAVEGADPDLTSREGIVAAYRAGRVTRDAAEAARVSSGFAMAPA